MSENNKTTKTTGFSFTSLLAVAFIVLKLGGWTEVANWSWWWVLSPIWITSGMAILFTIIGVIASAWEKFM